MTIDPRLHRIVAAQPYPLLFATTTSRRRPGAMAGQGGAQLLPLERVVARSPKELLDLSPGSASLRA